MDGLECSEVNISKLEFSSRIDAEYYRKSFLEFENRVMLSNYTSLCEAARFLIGPFGSAYDTSNYTTLSNYRYVRGQDVKPFILKDDEPRFIARCDFERLSKYSLKEQDIMVSVVGTLGNACLVRSKDLPAIFSCKSTVIRTKKLNPYYLIAYLNSKYGSQLLLRKERGAIQKGLNLDDLKSLIVPVFSNILQSAVQKSICNAYNMLDNSKLAYSQAEQILLDELGVTDFTPSAEKISVKNFADSFGACGRLDAEFYQRKYDQIETAIAKYHGGYVKFGDCIKYIFTGEYAEQYYTAAPGLKFYIRSTNMNHGQIDIDSEYYVSPQAFTKSVTKGDIITARVGTIGKFAEVEENLNDAICSDNVICFRFPDEYNPSVYTLLLNSKIMFELIDRLARGSVQQRLNQETLKDLIVPIISPSIQLKIADKIQESFSLRKQSDELLVRAKQAVEMAIEKDEQTALNWLSNL